MFYHVISLVVYLSCEGALNEESFWHNEDEGMLLSRAVGSYVDARTHPSDPKNAKAAAFINTTSESSSGYMLIVSVSLIYARETM